MTTRRQAETARAAALAIVLWALAAAAGCSSAPARRDGAAGSDPAAVRGMVGRVVRVNPDLGYVIVRGRDLPSGGEEAKVFRQERQVGVVRFAGPVEHDWAAPDIVNGDPRPGDRVVLN